MNKIKLNLPSTASIVFDNLYDVMPLASLGEDLCAIQLPGNRYIDIGWFPPQDAQGCYVIRVFQGDIDNLIEPPLETTRLEEVVHQVEELATKYATDDTSKTVARNAP